MKDDQGLLRLSVNLDATNVITLEIESRNRPKTLPSGRTTLMGMDACAIRKGAKWELCLHHIRNKKGMGTQVNVEDVKGKRR